MYILVCIKFEVVYIKYNYDLVKVEMGLISNI